MKRPAGSKHDENNPFFQNDILLFTLAGDRASHREEGKANASGLTHVFSFILFDYIFYLFFYFSTKIRNRF